MQTIDKSNEPPCLAQARRDARRDKHTISAHDWDDVLTSQCKANIRTALHHDQYGLCVYCGGRITTQAVSAQHPSGIRIEHWAARTTFPQLTFTWDNLFGACAGGEYSLSPAYQHCDVYRGSTPLKRHPSNTPELSNKFNIHKTTGTLTPAHPDDQDTQHDITTLNLNTPRLKQNRATAIAHIRQKIQQDDSTQHLKTLYRTLLPQPHTELPPYASTTRLYLAKKLRQRNIDPTAL